MGSHWAGVRGGSATLEAPLIRDYIAARNFPSSNCQHPRLDFNPHPQILVTNMKRHDHSPQTTAMDGASRRCRSPSPHPSGFPSPPPDGFPRIVCRFATRGPHPMGRGSCFMGRSNPGWRSPNRLPGATFIPPRWGGSVGLRKRRNGLAATY